MAPRALTPGEVHAAREKPQSQMASFGCTAMVCDVCTAGAAVAAPALKSNAAVHTPASRAAVWMKRRAIRMETTLSGQGDTSGVILHGLAIYIDKSLP